MKTYGISELVIIVSNFRNWGQTEDPSSSQTGYKNEWTWVRYNHPRVRMPESPISNSENQKKIEQYLQNCKGKWSWSENSMPAVWFCQKYDYKIFSSKQADWLKHMQALRLSSLACFLRKPPGAGPLQRMVLLFQDCRKQRCSGTDSGKGSMKGDPKMAEQQGQDCLGSWECWCL